MARFENLTVGNISGGIEVRTGTTLPALGKTGYPKGCQFVLKNSAGSILGVYTNRGTSSACMFEPYDCVDARLVALTTGVTAETVYAPVAATDIAIGGYTTTDDTDQFKRVAAQNGSYITKQTDPLAAHTASFFSFRKNAKGGPRWGIIAAGTFTTAGGDTTETITATGATADDLCIVQVKTKGAAPVTIARAVTTANAITVTTSADPSTDHVLAYAVFRPLAHNTTVSHEVVFAGTTAATTGSATQTITVTGAATTDIAFSGYDSTDDSDVIVTSTISAANTLTIALSADPLAAHVLNYIVVRAV